MNPGSLAAQPTRLTSSLEAWTVPATAAPVPCQRFPLACIKLGLTKISSQTSRTMQMEEPYPFRAPTLPSPIPLLGSPEERPPIAALGSTGPLVRSPLLPPAVQGVRLAVQNLPLRQKWPHEAQLTPAGHVHIHTVNNSTWLSFIQYIWANCPLDCAWLWPQCTSLTKTPDRRQPPLCRTPA